MHEFMHHCLNSGMLSWCPRKAVTTASRAQHSTYRKQVLHCSGAMKVYEVAVRSAVLNAGGSGRAGQNSAGTQGCSEAGASCSAKRHSRQCYSIGNDTYMVTIVTYMISKFCWERFTESAVHLLGIAVCCVAIILQAMFFKVVMACFLHRPILLSVLTRAACICPFFTSFCKYGVLQFT